MELILRLGWPVTIILCGVIIWELHSIAKAIKQTVWFLKTHFYEKEDEEVDD